MVSSTRPRCPARGQRPMLLNVFDRSSGVYSGQVGGWFFIEGPGGYRKASYVLRYERRAPVPFSMERHACQTLRGQRTRALALDRHFILHTVHTPLECIRAGSCIWVRSLPRHTTCSSCAGEATRCRRALRRGAWSVRPAARQNGHSRLQRVVCHQVQEGVRASWPGASWPGWGLGVNCGAK